ncbi:class I SAM-dependent methyltransferase [Thiohalomonas denitrificans]|uniref:Methyltransferase domain-containing protein n=1 Tax=Thiohalomonas denitrificans TaxID=415747 RepID=A0A1G5PSA3_9GAMM|nr:class I SAM-dependent methyltransferase [Thiohalomonas denitrificans]SCZ52206.1 Methyltransferase domain-containing protein [Thiohalomonas denitrificans]
MKGFLRLLLVLLFIGGAFAGPSGVVAEQEAQPRVDPSINVPYRDPDFDSWVRTFERPGREVYDRRKEIVEATGLEAGQAVADIGAGTGLFTLMFAEAVGSEGRVYAVDISRSFIRNIERRAEEREFDNVEGIVNNQRSVELPARAVDMAFLSDTYHHFEYPHEILASVHRSLRPNGTLVVIDFRKEGGSGWVQGHVRAKKTTVIEEIESAGFELIEDRDFLEKNYFLRFRKVGDLSP